MTVEDFLASAQIKKARELAREYLRKDFTEENFLNLLRVLVTMRDVKTIEAVLDMWVEEKGYLPRSFNEALALYYMLSMQTDGIWELLPSIPDNVSFWVLVNMGYPDHAANLGLTSYPRRAILSLMDGRDFQPPEDVQPLEALFFKFFNAKRYMISGEFNRALLYLNQTLSTAVRQGALAIGLNALILRGALKMQVGDIGIAKFVSEGLGDRMGYTLALIYEGLVEGYVPDLDIPEDFRTLYVMYEYLKYTVRGEGVFRPYGGLRHIYNMWWYFDKIRKESLYITFAGRLNLMRGREVQKVPKKQLICVAFAKLGGKELLERYAHVVFPDSKSPQRRAVENLSRASHLRFLPSDMFITLRFGNFLRDEEGEWAEVLKREALNRCPEC